MKTILPITVALAAALASSAGAAARKETRPVGHVRCYGA